MYIKITACNSVWKSKWVVNFWQLLIKVKSKRFCCIDSSSLHAVYRAIRCNISCELVFFLNRTSMDRARFEYCIVDGRLILEMHFGKAATKLDQGNVFATVLFVRGQRQCKLCSMKISRNQIETNGVHTQIYQGRWASDIT